MKIVSLLPSATEIVYFLGLQDELEGVTFECDYPVPARSKRVVLNTALPLERDLSVAEIDRLVTDFMQRRKPIYVIDDAAIAAIRPDLILAQDLCRVCAVPSGQVADALDRLGCTADVISLDPRTMDDVFDGIERVARATGGPDPLEQVAELRARRDAVTHKADSLPRVRTLALEWPGPPFIGGHWVPEMVEVAGGSDVLGRAGEPSRKVSWDDIEAAAPEAIVYMPCGYDLEAALAGARGLFEVPQFAETPAARAGRVFATDASAYFSRPGPRLADGLEMLAWLLHPDDFAPPPPGRAAPVSA